MDPFLRFKQPGLESAYSEQASARASRLDATSSLTLLAFFALRVIRWDTAAGRSPAMQCVLSACVR